MWNRWRVASKAFFGSKKSQSCIGSACTFATQPTRGDEPNFLELLDHPLTRMFVANVQGHNCKRKILFIQGKNNSGLERNFAKKNASASPKKQRKGRECMMMMRGRRRKGGTAQPQVGCPLPVSKHGPRSQPYKQVLRGMKIPFNYIPRDGKGERKSRAPPLFCEGEEEGARCNPEVAIRDELQYAVLTFPPLAKQREGGRLCFF